MTMAPISDQFNIDQWSRMYVSPIHGRVKLPAREEQRFPLPPGYEDPIYAQILRSIGIADAQVWNQQSEALETLAAGFGNAVISTPTASGKSLVFQLGAIRKLMQSPADRVLVFYPTRALNNDQRESWKKIMAAAGYNENELAIIDGSVPREERLDLLRDARVALMTPDTVHAWMMARLDNPVVRDFFKGLSLKILDEAHLYDGVFGSYMSLLLKRIEFAQRTLNPRFRDDYHDQIIMATATLPDPEKFAKKLVGRDAWIIGPETDTSPQYEREVILARTKDRKGQTLVRSLLRELAPSHNTGSILAFVGSRTNADEIADDVNNRLIQGKSEYRFAAHRSGLTSDYRDEIEKSFRGGTLKGIIATPTMDVGVDFPNVRTVVMDGLPNDPGRFKQRFGRLRKGGTCIIVAEDSTLLRLGQGGLLSYLREPAHQPLQYPANAKIAAEQALCFINELEQLGVTDFEETAAQCQMPAKFLNAVSDYQEKEVEDLSVIQRAAMPPADRAPHLYHSIRSIDGPIRKLRIYNPGADKTIALGEVTQGQALREALPGMIVHANGRKYRVRSWGKAGGLNSTILLTALSESERKSNIRTRALVRTTARTYLNTERIPKGGLRSDDSHRNLMVHGQFDILRRAAGFVETGPEGAVHYQYDESMDGTEITKTRKNQTVIRTSKMGPPRESNFQTLGLAFRIDESYMKDRQLQILGNAIHRAFCEAFKVSPDDVGIMVNRTNIGYAPGRMEDRRTILLYDKHPGGMGFSRMAYVHFDKLAAQLLKDVKDVDPALENVVRTFLTWHTTLKTNRTPTYEQWQRVGQPKAKEGQVEAYLPKSHLMWTPPNSNKPVLVEVLDALMYDSEMYYRIRPVKTEFNPYRGKGRTVRSVRGQADKEFAVHLTRPDKLVRPDTPTWRTGVFDRSANAYVYANDNNDKRKLSGQGTTGSNPK